MRTTYRLVAVVIVSACFTTGARAASIVNGGFEADGTAFQNGPGYASMNGNPSTITGWTIAGDPFSGFGNIPLAGVSADPGVQQQDVFLHATAAPEGAHAGFIQVYGPGSVHTTSLTNTITGLVVGDPYEITFDENARNGTSPVSNASVLVNGNTVYSTTNITPSAPTSAQSRAPCSSRPLPANRLSSSISFSRPTDRPTIPG